MRNGKILESSIIILLLVIAAIAMLSPDWDILRKSYDFTVQLMLVYLFVGLGFLAINKKKLLYTSFVCCAGLCLFLKQSSNAHLRLPEASNDEKLTIAHFNTSSSVDGYESLLNAVFEADADIVSFQEVTPDWASYLENTLSGLYPFNVRNTRIDPYGMAIFSKKEITSYDTFHYQEIPHQIVNIPVSENESINIINAHVLPPVGQRLMEKTQLHLDKIASHIQTMDSPSIVLGDFNMVYWSNEIRNFRSKAQLGNSRRDISKNLLKVPYDHIFYGEKLECIEFTDLSDTISNHMGIVGTYQIKNILEAQEGRMPGLFSN